MCVGDVCDIHSCSSGTHARRIEVCTIPSCMLPCTCAHEDKRATTAAKEEKEALRTHGVSIFDAQEESYKDHVTRDKTMIRGTCYQDRHKDLCYHCTQTIFTFQLEAFQALEG